MKCDKCGYDALVKSQNCPKCGESLIKNDFGVGSNEKKAVVKDDDLKEE